MPIQGLNTIAAAGSDLQPMPNTCFRLILNTPKLVPYLSGSPYVRAVADSLFSQRAPLEVEFTPPTVRVDQQTVRIRNVERKYAGFGTLGDVSMTFHNFLNFYTHRFFYEWALICMGLKAGGAIPELRRLVPSRYKIDGKVTQYVSTPDAQGELQFIPVARWALTGVFPFHVREDARSNRADGDVVMSDIDFSVDAALPYDAAEARVVGEYAGPDYREINPRIPGLA